MRPVLLTIGGHPVSSFRVLQWLGLLSGLFVATEVAAARGLAARGERVGHVSATPGPLILSE